MFINIPNPAHVNINFDLFPVSGSLMSLILPIFYADILFLPTTPGKDYGTTPGEYSFSLFVL